MLDREMNRYHPADPQDGITSVERRSPERDSAGTARTSPPAPVVLIVGFDGSESARRSLRTAEALLRQRDGWLEVVYVAHLPAATSISGDGDAELDRAFDETTTRLSLQVRGLLEGREERWHFRRRDGARHDQLIAAANEIRQHIGVDATIAIVVGNEHRVASPLRSALVQDSPHPLVVVP
jgi:nucleotide-binding universal stress UspA family protein